MDKIPSLHCPLFPTQQDVATRAGVSRSTVSRALKNHPSIPPETRERIREAAASIGYQENPYVTANMLHVRKVAARSTQATIAFLTPFALGEWYANVLSYRKIYESANRRAHELGFRLDPISLQDRGLNDQRCDDILKARGVDGILVAPFENPFLRLRLEWSRYSVATLGFVHVKPRFSYAAANHYHNVNITLRRLHRSGYRRIGIAMPARANRYAQGVFEAAYRLFSAALPDPSAIPPFFPKDLSRWNKREFMTWLGRTRPDVVVCLTNDLPAWLSEEGIRIPQDLGIATLSRHGMEENWSGIDQHAELVGAAGVDIVAQQLHLNQRGAPPYPKAIFIEGQWNEGWTTVRQALAPND